MAPTFTPLPQQAGAVMGYAMDSVAQLGRESRISPHPSGSQNEIFVMYTVENLFKGRLPVAYVNDFSRNTFHLHPHQFLMSQCLLALAKVFFGLKNHESRILQGGLTLYGHGLTTLSAFFDGDGKGITIEVIFSVLSLAMTEVRTLACQFERRS